MDIRNASRRVLRGLRKVMWGTRTRFHSHLRIKALRMMIRKVTPVL